MTCKWVLSRCSDIGSMRLVSHFAILTFSTPGGAEQYRRRLPDAASWLVRPLVNAEHIKFKLVEVTEHGMGSSGVQG